MVVSACVSWASKLESFCAVTFKWQDAPKHVIVCAHVGQPRNRVWGGACVSEPNRPGLLNRALESVRDKPKTLSIPIPRPPNRSHAQSRQVKKKKKKDHGVRPRCARMSDLPPNCRDHHTRSRRMQSIITHLNIQRPNDPIKNSRHPRRPLLSPVSEARMEGRGGGVGIDTERRPLVFKRCRPLSNKAEGTIMDDQPQFKWPGIVHPFCVSHLGPWPTLDRQPKTRLFRISHRPSLSIDRTSHSTGPSGAGRPGKKTREASLADQIERARRFPPPSAASKGRQAASQPGVGIKGRIDTS